MIKKNLTILSCFIFSIATSQSKSFEKALGIRQLYIGQDAKSVVSDSLSKDGFLQTKRIFFPAKITYLATGVKTSFTDSVFYNVDSVNKVSAIIFKVANTPFLETVLLEKFGKPASTITFIYSSKLWKVPDETIILNELDNFTTIVVLYNNNPKSFNDIRAKADH